MLACPGANQLCEQAHSYACCTFGCMSTWTCICPGCSGDIKMNPGILTHKVFSRNAIAVIDPPIRPVLFLISATSLLTISRSGSRVVIARRAHHLYSKHPEHDGRVQSLLLIRPIVCRPSATMMAPVSVARSIMAAGL